MNEKDIPGSGLTGVMAQHEAELMRYPNVVGVSDGMKDGRPCIVVYVQRKIPVDELSEDAVLPDTIEGFDVDVFETGEIRPLGD